MAPTPSEWDARYRSADTPWDLGAPSPLIQRLVRGHVQPGARILVPGCGLGHDVEGLIGQGYDATGLDLSPTAIERADARLRAKGILEPTLIAGDFLDDTTLPSGHFDALVEHTCYCALPPEAWPSYVAAATRVLRPGGLLVGAFLDFDGGGPPYGTSGEGIRDQFASRFEVLHLTSAPDRFAPKDVGQLEVVLRVRR